MQPLNLRELFAKRILVLDSPWGEIVGAHAPESEEPGGERKPPETLALEDPAALTALHAGSIEAGADILLTATAAATGPALMPFGIEERAGEIMRASVQAARRAVEESGRRNDGTPLVAAVLGPLPQGIAPDGPLSLSEAIAAYRDAAEAAREGGPDLFLLDSFSDLRTLKAALIALREMDAHLPIAALMAFGANGRTANGATPAVAWAVARSLGVELIGATGALGPAEMLPLQSAFLAVSDLPLAFVPATQPMREGRRDELSPLGFARDFQELLSRGVAAVGCGGVRSRDHLRRLAKAARAHESQLPDPVQRLVVTSGTHDLEIGPRRGMVCAAEWPARPGETFRAQRGGGVEHLVSLLAEQALAEVQMLEIRSTMPHAEEAAFFGDLLPALPERLDQPLLIAAETPQGLKTALEILPGRTLISGVWGEESSYEQVFPLVRRHGAAVVVSCHTGKKIPETAEERLAIAESVLAAAINAGLRQEDLIFDPVLPSTQGKVVPTSEVLRGLSLIRERLGTPMLLRISRVSEGFPARGQLEAAFLGMAAGAGLDLAVLDAAKPRLAHLAMGASVLAGRDPGGRRFVARFRVDEKGEREPTDRAERGERREPRRLREDSRSGRPERPRDEHRGGRRERRPEEREERPRAPRREQPWERRREERADERADERDDRPRREPRAGGYRGERREARPQSRGEWPRDERPQGQRDRRPWGRQPEEQEDRSLWRPRPAPRYGARRGGTPVEGGRSPLRSRRGVRGADVDRGERSSDWFHGGGPRGRRSERFHPRADRAEGGEPFRRRADRSRRPFPPRPDEEEPLPSEDRERREGPPVWRGGMRAGGKRGVGARREAGGSREPRGGREKRGDREGRDTRGERGDRGPRGGRAGRTGRDARSERGAREARGGRVAGREKRERKGARGSKSPKAGDRDRRSRRKE